MVLKNILLTLIVAFGAFEVRGYAPAVWTPIRLACLALALLAFALWTLARFQLGDSLTVSAQAKKLVNHGLYSKIRNPIYFFSSLFVATYVLAIHRPKWLLILVAIIPLQVWRIGVESRGLEAKFGEEYRAYRATTWF